MIWKKKKDASAEAAETAEAKSGASAFAKKNGKWLVPVVVAAAAGAVFLISGGGNKAASRDVTYAETTPIRQDVSNSLSGTGTLNPANTYTVKSLVDGKILTGGFEEGDKVEEGDVLYTIDSSDASTNLEKASIALQQAQRSYDKTVDLQYVRAEVDGTVSSLKVAKGDQVTSGQEVAVIRDSSKMLLNLLFPAADAANFSVGQSADVMLDGTFETLKGTITAITGTDELSTGNLLVRTVTIRVNNAGGLTTAQAATASVNGVSSIASATFAYQAERTLTAQAGGTVSAINVQEGDAVSKGDILIELTGDDLTESIQSASESLRSAEISMQNQQDNMSNYTITSPISGTIIEKDAKQGDALTSGSTLCVIYDLSYLEMVINVDELQIGALSVGQKVQITADAVADKTYVGTVTRVSMKGSSSGGTTTYPITIRIDDTDGLRPGMNANAEIVVAEANNALVVPNAAVIRGGYVLVSKKSPSAANAVEDMDAPEGYVYVKVETGVSDDSYTEIKSGLQEDDTVAYDTSSVSDDYYSDSNSDSIW
ncbi:MAG: HlyD family efflux transporter periplasmic adaptor subunit [Faecalibacterium prausnitzii]|jgi:HlyD family secretion protein|uniref:efflux RND transporter periplasmic adaptor subunit n=1 Tax=Faecalibacterium prausnitzii TaxID=853 RepID=UPI001A4DB85A|nr:HlyD family efflux transporter periplasmic adaptor subunit [Faecalibacterium prausnitzii]MBS7057630.1 HlyD family efflux transporter periplasmic adaptor subunit [Faecalibacterium prausnitzii]